MSRDVTDGFKAEAVLHQGSAVSIFLFAMVMDSWTSKIRQESPWAVMFPDGMVNCRETRDLLQ